MVKIVHDYFAADTVHALLVLILVDFLLGVVAAFKARTFSLAYVAAFLRDDVITKAGGYFILYAGASAAGSSYALVSFFSVDNAANGAFTVAALALVGSITSSLADLGVAMPYGLARGEKPTPTPPSRPRRRAKTAA